MSKIEDRKPTVLSTRVDYENSYFRVHHDHLQWPNGHKGEYFVIQGRPFVVVIVENRRGEIALVQQYRYTVDLVTTELPKGLIEDGESPEVAARRELREEVNCTAEHLELLASIASSIGNSRKRCHIFLARHADFLAEVQKRDATEDDMRCSWVSVSEFVAKLRAGEIMDQDSLAAWALYREREVRP